MFFEKKKKLEPEPESEPEPEPVKNNTRSRSKTDRLRNTDPDNRDISSTIQPLSTTYYTVVRVSVIKKELKSNTFSKFLSLSTIIPKK